MTDPKKGLSIRDVARLTAQGKSNASDDHKSKTKSQIILDNIFTFFNFIFFFFAFLLITAGSYVNLTFMIVVVINAVIAIVQELKSKQILDRLTMLNAPKTTVIREGLSQVIPTEELVQGDICIFSTGNQIGADAVVVSGNIKVNESLVTGESDEIPKHEGDELLSGSFVVSGECYAELTKVGAESYISKLAHEAKVQGKKKQTEMMKSLSKLLKIIGFAMIPIGIIMFIQDMAFLQLSYEDSIVAVVAALVGMIPEGLYLLTSIRLAVSTAVLGKKNVLVHEMASVETLARVDVLCLDKTGTLTENVMSFEALVPLSGYKEEKEKYTLNQMLDDFVGNIDDNNSTMLALRKVFGKETKRKADTIFAFTSLVKYSAVSFEDESLVLGAPEKLLLDRYPEYREQIESYMNVGNRVLLFGRLPNVPGLIVDGEPLKRSVEPLALVMLTNPVRKTARSTMGFFRSQNVALKVISGDNAATVANVAMKVGIEGAENVVDASTLTTYEEIKEAVKKYNVFGRVLPEQKKMIVKALQEDGHVVAMTGDGVNDVLALKAADCSIAVGKSSDVVENVAQICLLDSDFSKMPDVVAEGRQVVNNIQRSASLFLVKNIFSIFTALFVIIVGSRFPLYPTQLSFYSFVVVGLPSFFIAMQPSNELIKGSFVRLVLKKAFPAALTEFIMVQVVSLIGFITNMTFDEITTISLIVMLVIGLVFIVHILQPLDKIRRGIIALSVFCVVAGIILFGPFFKISALLPYEIVWTVILSCVGVLLFSIILELLKRLRIQAKMPRNPKSKMSRFAYWLKGIDVKISKRLNKDRSKESE